MAHIISDETYERLTGDMVILIPELYTFQNQAQQIIEKKDWLLWIKMVKNHEFLTAGNFLVLTPRFSLALKRSLI